MVLIWAAEYLLLSVCVYVLFYVDNFGTILLLLSLYILETWKRNARVCICLVLLCMCDFCIVAIVEYFCTVLVVLPGLGLESFHSSIRPFVHSSIRAFELSAFPCPMFPGYSNIYICTICTHHSTVHCTGIVWA